MSDREPARQGLAEVHHILREAILDGEIAPGEVLSQVLLADRLGVSRTPLREALRMLQGEGLIESEPQHRVRVASFSLEDVEGLYALRVPLEVTAFRLSVPRMEPEDLAELEGCLGAMVRFGAADDYTRWRVPHKAFHRGLTAHAVARYDILLPQLFQHAERYRRISVGRSLSDRSATEHRAILDACDAGDSDLAAVLLAEHLGRSAFEIIASVDPSYHAETLRRVLDDVGRASGHPIDWDSLMIKPTRRDQPT